MTKEELRREVRKAKTQYATQMPMWSENLCHRISDLQEWRSAKTVLCYSALPDEPQLQTLIDEALANGKRVLLPVVVGDDLVIRQYEDQQQMTEGAFHIMEPIGKDVPLEQYGDIDLAIVPGMAFDAEGHRLGRGKGYYDRLLPRLKKAVRVGVCFPFQYIREIPHETHDVEMEKIITPL